MVHNYERIYIQTLEKILNEGVKKTDRTGVGTYSLFGESFKIDISKDFPLLTTKKVSFKNIAHELLWFMGNHMVRPYNKLNRTNIKYLVDNGVNIWNEWPYEKYKETGGELSLKDYKNKLKNDLGFANEHGNLGPVYGQQWTAWGEKRKEPTFIEDENGNVIEGLNYEWGVNQIDRLQKQLINNPFSRRHVLSGWNVAELKDMALPPCHLLTIFNVEQIEGIKYLNCHFTMRSNDFFLGNPYNVASYALLTHMLAKTCDMIPRHLYFSGTDVHLYTNHVNQAKEQIQRYYDGKFHPYPKLNFSRKDDVQMYKYEDFNLIGYKSEDSIKAPIAV